jgi:hypothetical protein
MMAATPGKASSLSRNSECPYCVNRGQATVFIIALASTCQWRVAAHTVKPDPAGQRGVYFLLAFGGKFR